MLRQCLPAPGAAAATAHLQEDRLSSRESRLTVTRLGRPAFKAAACCVSRMPLVVSAMSSMPGIRFISPISSGNSGKSPPVMRTLTHAQLCQYLVSSSFHRVTGAHGCRGTENPCGTCPPACNTDSGLSDPSRDMRTKSAAACAGDPSTPHCAGYRQTLTLRWFVSEPRR